MNKNRNKKNKKRPYNVNQIENNELIQIENALLDETHNIINQVMGIIKERLENKKYSHEDRVNDARQQHYRDNQTYERLYGNKSYHPNRSDEMGINQQNIQNKQEQQDNTINNVTMNIQRPRNTIEQLDQTQNITLPGGSQLYPGQQYNPRVNLQRTDQRNTMNQRQSYPQVQNRYQPTRGPGGRAEAPRDNVVIGAQALQYARNVANRVGSNDISMRSQRAPPRQNNQIAPRSVTAPRAIAAPRTSAAVRSAPVSVQPSRSAPVASTGPVVAQAA